jgi:acyl carrier protein
MTAADVASWDSLSNIRMVVAVEEEFGIQFTTAEITELPNVGAFVGIIEKKVRV